MHSIPWLFSATQIDTFLACERKWAWSKLEGLTAPGTESQERGKRVHSQIDAYQRDGTPLNLQTDEGNIALTGAHFWPRERGYKSEAVFCIQIAGHWVWGMMDLVLPGEVPEVTDHKTTTSFGYAPTPEELPGKVQAAIYALAAMRLSGKAKVRLRWIYYSTKAPFRLPAFPVIREVTHREIEETLCKVIDAADRMRDLVSRSPRPRALELAPTPAHCHAYNGCAYINLCKLTPADHLIASVTQGVIMSQANASGTQNAFLARLKAEAEAAQTGGGVNPPPASPPALPPQLPPMPVQSPALPPGAVDPATVPGLPPAQAGHYWAIVNNQYAQLAIPQAVTPPPPPALPTPPVPFPVPPAAAAVVPAFAQTPQAMAGATAATAPKRGRGRPPKAAPGATPIAGTQPVGPDLGEAGPGDETARERLLRSGFEFLNALADAMDLD